MASQNQQRGSRFDWLRRWITRKPAQLRPRVFPASGFETIDVSERTEEECMSIYKPELFYPVRLGQVFQNRYQVVTKLGFGSSATIWLAHDLQYVLPLQALAQILIEFFFGRDRKYVCLKVQINTVPNHHEVKVYEHLGKHQFYLGLLNIHFHPGNLLIGFEDRDKSLSRVEEAELKSPSPRKVLKDRTIYTSRAVIGNFGALFLCDFGNAHIGDEGSGIAMSISFRAPEIILGMKWSYPIDMWSVGVSVWHMVQAKNLFKIYDVNDQRLNNAHHLANMIALLGPPPLDYLKRSETYLEFWDEDGNWRGIVPIPHEKTLESLEASLQGDDRARFLDFTRALICWVPEARLTAKQTLSHPWAVKGYGDAGAGLRCSFDSDDLSGDGFTTLELKDAAFAKSEGLQGKSGARHINSLFSPGY
ncbi:hypothetical protein O1611_g2006 [Lasiodiplodia mahajangana]|uniref:Uncharacterized protein n=1 Tax=Lasiodiplodia mahajangana TaxID=1108764 RepID=A0ACC2JW36_9PEZI|nr:hypothetical protein O1611_g2006 [Lasiodiplodia mahajangana]